MEISDAEKQKFLEFLNRGEPPYDYERILLKNYFARVLSILEGRNPPPYELEIQPTSICNAGCSHCWARDRKKLENKLHRPENMKRVVEQILNFRKGEFEINKVNFCGSTGEPLVNPLTLYAIKEFYGKKLIRLFTNGIKLAENKNNWKYLKTISKVNNINISLDAGRTRTLHKIKPGTRNVSLEDILETIKEIKDFSENKTRVAVSYVITNENYEEILQATEKSKVYRADLIKFRINLVDRDVSRFHGEQVDKMLAEAKFYEDDKFKVVPIHSGEEIKEEKSEHFSSKKSGFKCFTCNFWACVGANGSLYPCGHVVSSDSRNYGSLLEEDFSTLWEGQKRKKIIDELPRPECDICSPFSLRINETMTYFSEVPLDIFCQLKEKYV